MFSVGDKVEYRLPMWSCDGLFLGGDVGPYTEWRRGAVHRVCLERKMLVVEFPATDGRGCPMSDYSATESVRFENARKLEG